MFEDLRYLNNGYRLWVIGYGLWVMDSNNELRERNEFFLHTMALNIRRSLAF